MGKGLLGIMLASILVAGLLGEGSGDRAAAQGGSRFFPETGHTVKGAFLAYWEQHGGLAQQGYPLTDEVQEVSPLDGKTYTVQYFERAVLERHPDLAPPFDVLLSQLGTFRYRQRYPEGAPSQLPNQDLPRYFSQTGHTVGGMFRVYWEQRGGLMQQGYPLSDEFQETSDLDGQTYTVQYFERAVFEWHPANKPPYDVLLMQLGKFRLAIGEARQAAARLASPPRIYAPLHSDVDAWPGDTGARVVYYSVCGAAPAPPGGISGRPGTPGSPCQQPMTLTTQLAPAGADPSGASLDVIFSATWDNHTRRHLWQLHVAAGAAALVQESGDRLPILPQ